jgi:hypothetical protein
MVARLSPVELEQVIKIVGRSPGCYPPGAYCALKSKRDSAKPPSQPGSLPPRKALQERATPQPKSVAKTPSARYRLGRVYHGVQCIGLCVLWPGRKPSSKLP